FADDFPADDIRTFRHRFQTPDVRSGDSALAYRDRVGPNGMDGRGGNDALFLVSGETGPARHDEPGDAAAFSVENEFIDRTELLSGVEIDNRAARQFSGSNHMHLVVLNEEQYLIQRLAQRCVSSSLIP